MTDFRGELQALVAAYGKFALDMFLHDENTLAAPTAKADRAEPGEGEVKVEVKRK